MKHEDYLKAKLNEKKLRLEQLQVMHQINIATFETKREMLYEDISSLEKQLHYDGK